MRKTMRSANLALSIIPATIALVSPQILLADAPGGQYYGHYGMMDGGGWFFGPIMMVIFFALLVGAVVLIVRLLGGGQVGANGSDAAPTGDRALSILRERLAKGEISTEEFAAAKQALDL